MSDVLDENENTENNQTEPQTNPQTEPTPSDNTENENGENTNGEEPSESGDEEVQIELIVEDGSCVSNANSYLTLEEAVQYQSDRGRTAWLALTDNEKKSSIIRATQYIDALYNWKGRRKYQSQELAFPRVEIYDQDGFEVIGIPKVLKKAVLEATFYGYNTDLFTTYSNTAGALKRDKNKVDTIETEQEYFNSKVSKVDYISQYSALDALLRGLYIPKNSKSVNARAFWRV